MPPDLTTSYSRTLFLKVFVCGGWERGTPPSLTRVVVCYTTPPPQNSTSLLRMETQFAWVCRLFSSFSLCSSSVVIQSEFKRGDSFRAARTGVCFCLHRKRGEKNVQFACNLGESRFKGSSWFVLMSSGILGRKHCLSWDNPVYFLYLASVVLKNCSIKMLFPAELQLNSVFPSPSSKPPSSTPSAMLFESK